MRIFVYSGGEQLKKKLILIGIAILVVLLTTWTIWGNVTVGITHYTVLSEKIPAAFKVQEAVFAVMCQVTGPVDRFRIAVI